MPHYQGSSLACASLRTEVKLQLKWPLTLNPPPEREILKGGAVDKLPEQDLTSNVEGAWPW